MKYLINFFGPKKNDRKLAYDCAFYMTTARTHNIFQ